MSVRSWNQSPAGTEGLELSLRGSEVIGGFSAAQASGPLAPKLFKGPLPLKWNDTTSGHGGWSVGSGATPDTVRARRFPRPRLSRVMISFLALRELTFQTDEISKQSNAISINSESAKKKRRLG